MRDEARRGKKVFTGFFLVTDPPRGAPSGAAACIANFPYERKLSYHTPLLWPLRVVTPSLPRRGRQPKGSAS
jgi:hypothetical protein